MNRLADTPYPKLSPQSTRRVAISLRRDVARPVSFPFHAKLVVTFGRPWKKNLTINSGLSTWHNVGLHLGGARWLLCQRSNRLHYLLGQGSDSQQHIHSHGETVIGLEKIKLASGREVASVGLGLWKIDQADTAAVVQSAIDCGYRHFDSACDYGNEIQTGEGLAAAIASGSVDREELWITSKLWNTYHRSEHVRPVLEKSLRDLQLDYLDLYLVHFPIASKYVPIEERYPPGWFTDPDAAEPRVEADRVPIIETWRAMEELVGAGLVREIGVCNFGCSLLRDLMNQAEIPPAMLQIEMHPYLTQEKLTRFCHEAGIGVTAFSPLGAQSYFQLNMAEASESLIEHQAIKAIAAAHASLARTSSVAVGCATWDVRGAKDFQR